MAANSKFSLFGFNFSRKQDGEEDNSQQSFSPPSNDDGALTITSAAYYGTYVDMDGTAKNEVELISRYREMAMQPEIESALDDIVNEAISQDDDGRITEIVLDSLKQPDKIKKAIRDEFETILRLLNYKNMAQDIFRRYYIDGKMYYHIIIDKDNPTEGIKELRYIDPRKLKKVREIKKKKDERTGVDVMNVINEYYIFNDKVVSGSSSNYGPVGVRITTDSIINVVSGLMDSRRAVVLSYLHKAIKPLNQLRMIEDATVIYRISRAPERRIFYIDVGNLPKLKAEQYLRDIMAKYKNKLVYDAATGEIRDDRKFMSMMEDFWLPRREGGKGTEITTLPGGQNLGELEDVKYFEKKLYKALNVPVSRLEPNQGFSLGRISEVTRDELKFAKFIDRMRNKFSDIFNQALRAQCIFKGICTLEEWDEFKEHIHYDFIMDNNFSEMKNAELMKERLGLLSQVDPYTGRYYSQAWIQRNVLCLNDVDITAMQKEIDQEKKDGFDVPVEVTNQVLQAQLLAQIEQPAQPGQSTPQAKQEDYNTFDRIKRVL
ncbi:portal vertex protein [uncultured Caudovirales phage]|uniref:Portal protein n=1 Tax=uncultured Caudovirales phage TaxID=2100421 RepID=A0A6J5T6V6_9CAUD|nr:portal vertex protein [uncultured Caudovirales phage]